ncbi:MAG: RHS repeat-associated core domain-containing protein, partial [Candidatus Gracilibacteria bacterium]|nr:RHS repeat-associated core domain-containing protein [Candidatus Gracilibacteria bacterium]
TGREYDKELGLYYNRARYYNPELARFISRDPIDIADDVNLYAYVGNNGVNYVDRSGTAKLLISDVWKDISTDFFLTRTWILGEGANLDVSSYMLRKFMYGDGSNDYYDSNHWISEKLKKSDFYNRLLNSTKNEVLNNVDKYKKQSYRDYGKGDLTEGLFTDFPTSFGTVDWEIKAKINSNGKIETNFNIKDTYIYNDYYGDGSIIDNPFNVLAKYYQDRGYGTPFKWELNITETFNY